MSPENVELAIRLLHSSAESTVEGMRALAKITKAQKDMIDRLEQRIRLLEARNHD